MYQHMKIESQQQWEQVLVVSVGMTGARKIGPVECRDFPSNHLKINSSSSDHANTNCRTEALYSSDTFHIQRQTLSTTPYGLTKKIIEEIRQQGKISSETMVELLGYGNELSAGALLLLGGPNHFINPGYIKQIRNAAESVESFEELVHEHFNVANGFNIDPAAVTDWATQGVTNLSQSERAKSLLNKILATAKAAANVQDEETEWLSFHAIMDVAQNKCSPPRDAVRYYDSRKGKWIYTHITAEQAEYLRTAYHFKCEHERVINRLQEQCADFRGYLDPDKLRVREALENKRKSDTYFDIIFQKAVNSFNR
jgi:hypothetical protein